MVHHIEDQICTGNVLLKKTRDISPKSVINPPFRSQPSSNSGSMEHRVLPVQSSFESNKPSKEVVVKLPKYGVENPFSENFHTHHQLDPLCKINLRETSEFVKSFPMAKKNVSNNNNPFTEKWAAGDPESRPNSELKVHRIREGNRLSVPKRLDCLGTPPRPAENPLPVKYMTAMGGFSRRAFPSKWDDAEKWLINSSCNDSLSHNNSNNNNPFGRFIKANTNTCRTLALGFQSQACETNAVNPVSGNEMDAMGLRHVEIMGQKVGTEDVKLRAGSDDRSNMGDKYLGGGLVMGDVSSRVSSSVLSTDINLSSSLGSGSSEHGAFAALPSDVFMKDKFTDKVEPAPRYKVLEPGKIQHYGKHEGFQSMKDACTEVIPAVQHRDMGTDMTPLGSSRTSRCHTPVKAGSPARHNTPASRSALINSAGIDIGELEKCHFANLELQGLPSGIQFNSVDKSVSTWSSREEEEEEVSKSLRHFDMGDCKKSIVEIRAAAWEEAERSKCFTRYQREEARIEAWINLQTAKAEAETKKLEVKIEKMRSHLEEKLMKKMAGAHKRADEWRTAAKAQHAEQILKSAERAERMRRDGNVPFNLSACSCFSCRP